MPGRIGVILFDGVEELDAVGPWEVLSAWALQWPDDGWEIVAVSPDGRPVRGAKGLSIGAHSSYDDVGRLDVVIHPGGIGTRALCSDDVHLARVRAWSEAASLTTSVCTGSLVYAAAGLLRRRPATTHWDALAELAELDPTIDVRPDDRFVDDGDIVTSAGVSAGIDMALHLVSRLHSTGRARQVRRYIQYDPAPPV